MELMIDFEAWLRTEGRIMLTLESSLKPFSIGDGYISCKAFFICIYALICSLWVRNNGSKGLLKTEAAPGTLDILTLSYGSRRVLELSGEGRQISYYYRVPSARMPMLAGYTRLWMQ